MRSCILLILSLLLLILPPLQAQDDQVLMSIGENEISLGEFEWMYQKSASGEIGNTLSREDYLSDFIDYKLRVMDAMESGLDKKESYKKEYADYYRQIMGSYLPERVSMEGLIREAWERSLEDISASHIVIRLSKMPSPEDTLIAYKKIQEIRKRAMAGEDFNNLALEYSEDPEVSNNSGYIGFFTPFSLLYPIETAAYNTPVGQVSSIFRTSQAYHIVKPHERREAYGQIRTAYLFIAVDIDDSQEMQMAAMEGVSNIFDRLKQGERFDLIGTEFMNDTAEATTYGKSDWFGVGEIGQPFEDMAFGISKLYDFSKPFRAENGWYILQLVEKKEVGSYEEEALLLKRTIIVAQRLPYWLKRNESRFKQKYDVEEDRGQLEKMVSSIDQSILKGRWPGGGLTEDGSTLLRIEQKAYKVSDFAAFILKEQEPDNYYWDKRQYIDILYALFKQDKYLEYQEALVLEEKPGLKYLLNEFHDGNLIYEITNEKVWSRAVEDTAGLREYYKDNLDNYMWDERTDAFIITCSKDTKIKKVKKKYKRIQDGSWDETVLNDMFCSSDTVQCIKLNYVITEKGIYEHIDAREGKPGPGPIYTSTNSRGFVIVNEVRSPEPKKLEEILGNVVSDYQAYLEKKWMEQIRKKYQVKVNRDLLKQK